MALGTNNGGAPYKLSVINCWYLDDSAAGGGYFNNNKTVDDGALVGEKMKDEAFVKTLGGAFDADKKGINGGYPILVWQKDIDTPMLSAYPDVSVTAWYYTAVSDMMARGLFDTVGDKAFGPEQPMTRAMLVTVLYRLDGEPEMTSEHIFNDISENAAYADAVNWAYSNGIVTGIGDSVFSPDGSITREQLAAMLFRYAKYAGLDTSVSGNVLMFSDASQLSSWAADAMKWSVGAGLINGIDGRIAPQDTATRAQVAAIIHRFAK
jgi:hypothetical protein